MGGGVSEKQIYIYMYTHTYIHTYMHGSIGTYYDYRYHCFYALL